MHAHENELQLYARERRILHTLLKYHNARHGISHTAVYYIRRLESTPPPSPTPRQREGNVIYINSYPPPPSAAPPPSTP
jgi:hypothetical protein